MLTVRVRSGARMGEVLRFKGPRVTVGRHPQADLRFGPNTDLEVSTFHAAFAEDAEGWFVRDLGSRNGTWVDGERVEGDRRIRGGETIQFGTGGPSCRLSLGKGGVDEAPEVEPPAPETREKVDGHESFTSIVRREVSRRTHRLSLLSALAVLVLLGAVTFVVLRSRSRMAEWESQRQVLRERLDSALRQADSASSSGNARIGGLSDALESSRERIRSLQEELDRARDASARELESLRRRLQAATAALERQQLAASVDFQEIYDRNWRAVALLYVEFAGGGGCERHRFRRGSGRDPGDGPAHDHGRRGGRAAAAHRRPVRRLETGLAGPVDKPGSGARPGASPGGERRRGGADGRRNRGGW